MHKTPELEFRTEELRTRWMQLCQGVLSFFSLPDYRLLCGFDDVRGWMLNLEYPKARGMHRPTYKLDFWPEFLDNYRYLDADQAPESLIYVPVLPPTDDPVIFAVTFAHEVQHFVQCWTVRKIWDVNNFFYFDFPWAPNIPEYETWRVPTELDAIITSKHVATALFGNDPVQSKVHSLISSDEGKEWQHFYELSPSASCDLLQDTDRLVREHRNTLLGLRDKWPPGIDFAKREWWK